MKIIIYNDELRSGMQMYLALSNHHEVTVAQDVEDLLELLDQAAADMTIMGLASSDQGERISDSLDIAQQIQNQHPHVKVIGIYDQGDNRVAEEARSHGIDELITRPIKNRELLGLIERE